MVAVLSRGKAGGGVPRCGCTPPFVYQSQLWHRRLGIRQVSLLAAVSLLLVQPLMGSLSPRAIE